MAVEIEKKYRLTDAQRNYVLDSLKEIGAKFHGEDFEENVIFLGGVLNEKPAILRLRRTDHTTTLTYKEGVQNEFDVKQRIEYETKVEDFANSEKIIESLGFSRSLIYEKRRRTWQFRDVEIVLDELPFGLFMEIEGSITAIKEAEMLLGIEDFETEHETYPRLTAKLGKRNGHVIEARFDTNPNE